MARLTPPTPGPREHWTASVGTRVRFALVAFRRSVIGLTSSGGCAAKAEVDMGRTETSMRNSAFAVGVALGCTVLGCGGSQGRAASPSASTENESAETDRGSGEDEESSEDEASSD